MASLARLLGAGLLGNLLHPRECLFISGNLGSQNAEVLADCDGSSTVTLDLRGTFNLTVEVAGTVDGANWIPIPMRPLNTASVLYVAAVTGSAAGTWIGQCAGFRRLRARCTLYTSGSATTFLSANTAPYDNEMFGPKAINVATLLGTAGTVTTLTLASPGAGLRHYLTYLTINRFASALLTANATPVAVTTGNLPGSLAFSFASDAAALGTLDRLREDWTPALPASAQGTATQITCPATPSVIWRITAGFYVAP